MQRRFYTLCQEVIKNPLSMRKTLLCIAVPCTLFLLIASCKKTVAKETSTPTEVTVKTGETYQYDMGLLGDEEGVMITQQAAHFQKSEVVRLQAEHVIYTYVAAPGYSGTDEVVLQTNRGSDGASAPKVVTSTTLHFTITN
jgi:hypothetical protein